MGYCNYSVWIWTKSSHGNWLSSAIRWSQIYLDGQAGSPRIQRTKTHDQNEEGGDDKNHLEKFLGDLSIPTSHYGQKSAVFNFGKIKCDPKFPSGRAEEITWDIDRYQCSLQRCHIFL